MLRGDSAAMVQSLSQTNPQFAQFLAQNQGVTPQEAFRRYGYDFDEVMAVLNS